MTRFISRIKLFLFKPFHNTNHISLASENLSATQLVFVCDRSVYNRKLVTLTLSNSRPP